MAYQSSHLSPVIFSSHMCLSARALGAWNRPPVFCLFHCRFRGTALSYSSQWLRLRRPRAGCPRPLPWALDSEGDLSLNTTVAPFPLVLVGVASSLTGVVKSPDSRLELRHNRPSGNCFGSKYSDLARKGLSPQDNLKPSSWNSIWGKRPQPQ